MQLPSWLREAIEDITAEVPQRDLARAAAELSEAYRAGDFCRAPLDSHARRAAYLAQRLPATYAACTRVFDEIRALAPEFAPKSMLDLGAGPGTATLAVLTAWPAVESCTLLERDPQLIACGKRLLAAESHGDAAYHVSARWLELDLGRLPAVDFSEGHDFSRAVKAQEMPPASAAEVPGPQHDIAILSYALGEFSKAKQRRVAELAWNSTLQFLILIEPGTLRGFQNVLSARDHLTALGAHILAPCPRSDAHTCPMAAVGDWCHFAQRVERSSLHRTLKAGELGYEDEKFAYVVLSRQPRPTVPARIVRHPTFRKGHVELQLCTPQGLQRVTIGKSEKERYRAARKSSWGDAFQI